MPFARRRLTKLEGSNGTRPILLTSFGEVTGGARSGGHDLRFRRAASGESGMTISTVATPDCVITARGAAFPLRVTSILLSLILLAASGLKIHQFTRSPAQARQSRLDVPAVVLPLSITELLLASLLLSGLWPGRTRKIAIGVFALFAVFAVVEGITGRKNCGCFGAVHVSPWITASFDLCAVAALAWFKPGHNAVPRNLPRIAFATVIVVAGVATAAVWEIHRPTVVTADLAATNGVDPFGAPDSLVVLEPSGWANKPFALASHIDGDAQLANGRWIVLLVHHDCDQCIAAVPQYEAAIPQDGNTKLAVIEMPPYAGPSEGFAPSSAVALTGRLDTTRDWFATTPVAILLDNGIVQAAAEGDAVATPNPAWWRSK
jgi:methylamine utilization protein MauE